MLRLPQKMQNAINTIRENIPRDRWQPRRVQFINIFRVGEPETLHFADGKLFLDGSNGSGKSALMALLITPVFDRQLTPERIDTGKSKSKNFVWHLTGNLEPDESERTGYVVIEMVSPTGQALMFGYGAHARKGRSEYTHWSFIVEAALEEVQFINEELVPLSQRAMKAQMERISGRFYGTPGEEREAYQEALNDMLFGFESLQEYKNFIEFLTELRRPNIGHELSVERVERFIKDSLPAIPTSIIEGAASTYSGIIQLRNKAEQTAHRADLIRKWAEAQWRMSTIDCRSAFDDWYSWRERHEKALHEVSSIKAEVERHRKKIAESTRDVDALTSKIAELDGKKKALEAKRDSMQGVLDLQKSLGSATMLANAKAQTTNLLNGKIQDAESQLETLRNKIDEIRTAIAAEESNLRFMIGSFGDRYRTIGWAELADEIRQSEASSQFDFRFDIFRPEAERRATVITRIGQLMRDIESAKKVVEEAAEGIAEAQREVSEAEERLRRASRNWESACADYAEEVLKELHRLPEFQHAVIDIQPASLPTAGGPSDVVQHVREATQSAVERVLQAFTDEIQHLSIGESSLTSAYAKQEQHLIALREQTEATPDTPLAFLKARTALEQANITSMPFYAVVEAAVDSAITARVEEALLDAGILNRLVVHPSDLAEAERILESRGLAEIICHIDERAGNLQQFLCPTTAVAFPTDLIERTIRAIPINIDPGTGRWQTPGAQGFCALTHETVEYIGSEARKTRRLRLIAEAEAELQTISSKLKTVREQIRMTRSQSVRFRENCEAIHKNAERRNTLNLMHGRKSDEEIRKKTADQTERQAVRKHQEKLTRYNSLKAEYKRVRGSEKWLPPASLSVEALEMLREKLRAIPHEIESLNRHRNQVATQRHALLEYTSQQNLAAERMANDVAQRKKIDSELEELRSEIQSLQDALEDQAPEYNQILQDIQSAEEMLSALNNKRNEQGNEIVGATALLTKATDESLPKAEEIVRAEAEQFENKKRDLRRFLHGLPQLEAQLQMFERENWDEFALEMDSALDDTKPDSQRAKAAREALAAARAEALPHFMENRPDHDQVTQIPSFYYSETGETLDVWSLAEHIENSAAAMKEDMNDRLRAGMERFISNDLYGTVADLIRQTETTKDNLNRILAGIRLQRDQGNLMLDFKPSTTIVEEGEGTRLTGADMIKMFSAGDWLLRTDREKDQTIARVAKQIEKAYTDSISGYARESFTDLLKERFDYRNWFSTEVFRKDESGAWVDLRKDHGRGSEGMQAMDLLQPMVAGARLRLLSARKDAPCLLALDEVFAKLDEIHCTAILQTLEALECDWVLATEKGLHPTEVVPGAACYTVDWDGHDFQLFPAVWTGKKFVTMAEVDPDELIPVSAEDEERFRQSGQLELV